MSNQQHSLVRTIPNKKSMDILELNTKPLPFFYCLNHTYSLEERREHRYTKKTADLNSWHAITPLSPAVESYVSNT
eukprot:scaffold422965_cov62-Attheya_sp.AAC.2